MASSTPQEHRESQPRVQRIFQPVFSPIICVARVLQVALSIFAVQIVVFHVLVPALSGNVSHVLTWLLLSLALLMASGLMVIKSLGLATIGRQFALPRWAQPATAFTIAGLLLVYVIYRTFLAAPSARQMPVIALEAIPALIITGVLFIKRVPRWLFDAGNSEGARRKTGNSGPGPR
jgi:hypothetical protein